MMRPELSERHLSAFNYVRMNPDCSKEAVRRGLDGIASKVTVLNILGELEEDGLIIVRKDKPNSQIYHIYVNYENELASAIDYTQRFRSLYNQLLEDAEKRLDEITCNIGNLNRSDYRQNIEYFTEKDLLRGLYYINKFFIDTGVIFQVYSYRDRVKDNNILMRLHFAVNSAICQIQENLLNTISRSSLWAEGEGKALLAQSVFLNPITIDIESLYLLKVIFYKNGLAAAFDPLMDFMWEVACQFTDLRKCVGFEAIGIAQRLVDLKDWRKVLDEYGKYYNVHGIVHNSLCSLGRIV